MKNNFIARLNNIKIEDLKNLKDLDYKKILHDVLKKPDIVVIIVVVAITFFVSVFYFQKRNKEAKIYDREIPALEEKIKTIEEYNKVTDELQNIIDNIPEPITEGELIDFLTNVAMKYSAQIKSFSPAIEKEKNLHNLVEMTVSISVKDYRDLWVFINTIEKSAYPLRIESWAGQANLMTGSGNRRSTRGARRKTLDDEKDKMITANLKIAILNIKND